MGHFWFLSFFPSSSHFFPFSKSDSAVPQDPEIRCMLRELLGMDVQEAGVDGGFYGICTKYHHWVVNGSF